MLIYAVSCTGVERFLNPRAGSGAQPGQSASNYNQSVKSGGLGLGICKNDDDE